MTRYSNFIRQQNHKSDLPISNSSNNPRSRRKISPTEMQAKKAQGLCYFCNERYTISHKCNLRKQLFILEIDEK